MFDGNCADEMVKFYKSIFKGTKVGKFSYWGKNPMGVKEGSVSLVVPCKTQREIDIKKLKAAFDNA